jgi:hypothetical protein
MSIPCASVICTGSVELTYHPSGAFSSFKIMLLAMHVLKSLLFGEAKRIRTADNDAVTN